MISKKDAEVLIDLTNVAVGLSIVIVNWAKVTPTMHQGANDTLRCVMSEIHSYFKKD